MHLAEKMNGGLKVPNAGQNQVCMCFLNGVKFISENIIRFSSFFLWQYLSKNYSNLNKILLHFLKTQVQCNAKGENYQHYCKYIYTFLCTDSK